MISLPESIIRQYSNSNALIQMIENFNSAMNIEKMSDDFYTNIMDIDTCNDVGLDIWGKIVNISRYLLVDEEIDSFGFNEASEGFIEQYPQTFNHGTFYDGQATSNMRRLSTDAYRKLIKFKALYNISNATIPTINNFLRTFFADKGRAFAIDNLNMTISITFEFMPDPVDISIIKNSNVIPRPAGVKFNFSFVEPPYFGFADDAFPFNDGTFYRGT